MSRSKMWSNLNLAQAIRFLHFVAVDVPIEKFIEQFI
jgi:hypothetical protein